MQHHFVVRGGLYILIQSSILDFQQQTLLLASTCGKIMQIMSLITDAVYSFKSVDLSDAAASMNRFQSVGVHIMNNAVNKVQSI